MSTTQFRRKYVIREHGIYRLVERDDGGCIFLGQDMKCQVYEARPKQCRTYPFWPELLADETSWEWEGIKCPGIGKGDMIPAAEIRLRRDEHK